MSSKRLAEFPGVEAKLQKPTKKSAFERQREEAEAKRQREAAETAAVYEDFVKSFDREDRDSDAFRDSRPPPNRHDRSSGFVPLGGSSGKRHFGVTSTPSGIKSGPGSLGPPPSSFGKKRAYDGSGERRDREEGKGRLAFEDDEPMSISKAFDASDEEGETTAAGRAEEKAIAKPTLRLANLPPGTSPFVIKALIPTNLVVENVKTLAPNGPAATDRRSTTAIVTLSKETPATDIDAAVSALQNRYLGFGFYLSLHRHLSSAAISSSLASMATSSTVSQPFGAKPVPQTSGNHGPPHMSQGRGFAPPSSYGPPGAPVHRSGLLHVAVQPPKDIKRLRMIHKVTEGILEHGPEFEALLMTRPDVQREERWAWIWDPRSEGAVWYRYRLWEIITGSKPRRGQRRFLPLFEGSHAWKAPDQLLPYEYRTGVDEFVSDSEYNSSDDDDFDDELHKQGEPGPNDQEDTFLNPIEKSKLTHLLARLPTSLPRLRNGDIARITTFAITHASHGADEIVDMIVSNIERPFARTSANPAHRSDDRDREYQNGGSRGASPRPEEKQGSEVRDTSGAKLIGLYVASDILSSSSTSGVRHAWRYRQLFEAAMRTSKVFEGLGLMAERLNWGRLRAEKWKRSVGLVLAYWEGRCVFPAETQELLVNSFENPPTLKTEEKVDDDGPKKGRWKTVDASTGNAAVADAALGRPRRDATGSEGVDEAASEGAAVDGGPGADTGTGLEVMYYTDDEELDLQCLDREDIDGWPDDLDLSKIDGRPMEGETESDAPKATFKSVGGFQMSSAPVVPSRKRMRAVDMFADSDSDGGG